MSTFWVIILVTVHMDGKVESILNYPNKPEYNNEQDCNTAGNAIMEKMQTEIGSKNATVFFRCEPIPYDSIKNAVGGGTAT